MTGEPAATPDGGLSRYVATSGVLLNLGTNQLCCGRPWTLDQRTWVRCVHGDRPPRPCRQEGLCFLGCCAGDYACDRPTCDLWCPSLGVASSPCILSPSLSLQKLRGTLRTEAPQEGLRIGRSPQTASRQTVRAFPVWALQAGLDLGHTQMLWTLEPVPCLPPLAWHCPGSFLQ